MAVFRRLFALAFVCLASLGVAQRSDQLAAARVLGPRWEQLSRSAGMIFSGTVLGVETQRAGKDRPLPLVLTKFRVDRAIAGVQSGQVLTVREWAGAWPLHRAMRGGLRLLIFLYPPSRLGLTSPVGGPLGQVVLDSRGEIVRTDVPDKRLRRTQAETLHRVEVATSEAKAQFRNNLNAALKRCSTQSSPFLADCSAAAQPIASLRQLERAIRDARENASAVPARIRENASAAPARTRE
jgi:hypothetical protein